MDVLQEIPGHLSYQKPIITIGNFDGVHRGHQSIFRKMVDLAQKQGGDTIVITFKEHPKRVLYPESSLKVLTSVEEKISFMKQSGVDHVIVIDFTEELSKMHAGEFINEIMVKRLHVSQIVMGYDHAFGKNREGNIDYLMTLAMEKDFTVIQIPPFIVNAHPVSSTWIKNELLEGNVSLARELLGRPYELTGTVISGHRRGRGLGFPTANILPVPGHKVIPHDGVYAVEVKINQEKKYYGMLNIGTNPTFHDHERSIEVHILDFNEDIYNEKITVSFYQSIRSEHTFTSSEELVQQLQKDKEYIYHYFKRLDA